MRFKFLLFSSVLSLIFTSSCFADTHASINSVSPPKIVQPVLKSENNLNEPVNINTATVNEIATAKLAGIGKKRAEEIVEFRNQHGPFKSIEDLKNIRGITAKVIENNNNRIIVK